MVKVYGSQVKPGMYIEYSNRPQDIRTFYKVRHKETAHGQNGGIYLDLPGMGVTLPSHERVNVLDEDGRLYYPAIMHQDENGMQVCVPYVVERDPDDRIPVKNGVVEWPDVLDTEPFWSRSAALAVASMEALRLYDVELTTAGLHRDIERLQEAIAFGEIQHINDQRSYRPRLLPHHNGFVNQIPEFKVDDDIWNLCYDNPTFMNEQESTDYCLSLSISQIREAKETWLDWEDLSIAEGAKELKALKKLKKMVTDLDDDIYEIRVRR